MVAKILLGTMPSLDDFEGDALLSSPKFPETGDRPSIVQCAQVIEREYLAVQREMADLIVSFYNDYPTRFKKRGYTLTPRKEKCPGGGMRVRKIYWRKYFIIGFEKQKEPGTGSEFLAMPTKKKCSFEFAKKRHLKLPYKFWEKSLAPETREHFKYYERKVVELNKKADYLAAMNKKIRALYQSLRRTSLFKVKSSDMEGTTV